MFVNAGENTLKEHVKALSALFLICWQVALRGGALSVWMNTWMNATNSMFCAFAFIWMRAGDERRDGPVSPRRRLFIQALPCSYAAGKMWRAPLICRGRETSHRHLWQRARTQGSAVEGDPSSSEGIEEGGLWPLSWEVVHSNSDMVWSGRRSLRAQLNFMDRLVWFA